MGNKFGLHEHVYKSVKYCHSISTWKTRKFKTDKESLIDITREPIVLTLKFELCQYIHRFIPLEITIDCVVPVRHTLCSTLKGTSPINLPKVVLSPTTNIITSFLGKR